jgi:uncharacterized membrane protein YheB (UPF0754 family)
MKFVIPIVVGAIIGYITNWLAIKMLFRPHTEKRFLGMRIPFTPGLIPKERSRIAKSVGETVGTHLLSPETVAEALSSQKINEQISSWIEEKITGLRESSQSIKDILIKIVGESYEEFKVMVEKRLTSFLVNQLKEEKLKQTIMQLIKDELVEKYGEKVYLHAKEKLSNIIFNISTSKELKEKVNKVLIEKIYELENEDRNLNQVIPETLINELKSYIYSHGYEISGFLKEMLNDESIQRRVKKSIAELVSQNASKVVTMFMSPDFIAEKVFSTIESYVANPENQRSILMIITTSIDKLLQSRVSDMVKEISIESKENAVNSFSNAILSYVSKDETQKELITIIEEKIGVPQESLKEAALNLIKSKLEVFLASPKLDEYVSIVVKDVVDEMTNKPISYIFEGLDKSVVLGISNLSKDIFDNFVKNKAAYIVELLNIPKVVEDQINSFDVAFAEKLIIEIADKELKAITWLGALLGGIMGILSPLLQLIYK